MDPNQQLTDAEQHLSSLALRTGLALSALDLHGLWTHCRSLDDVPDMDWLAAIIGGSQVRTVHQHNVVAQALNDGFIDTGQNHPVRYAAQLTGTPRAH